MIPNTKNKIDTSDFARINTTPQTPAGDTHVENVKLGWRDGGWVLDIEAYSGNALHQFYVRLTEIT